VLLLALVAVLPISAEEADQGDGSHSDEFGYRGWGIRVGLADSPDQFLIGGQVDLGYFHRHIRFRPDVELGFGDDITTLVFTAPVHYLFRIDKSFLPYAGGGVAAGFFDPKNGGSDFEIGLKAIGGLEWNLSNDDDLFVELEIGFGDVHDAQIIVGWVF
jgi:opacity protein-like surface antigen